MTATKPTRPRLVGNTSKVPQTSAVQDLALDLERAKGDLASHEDICAERYRGIQENQTAVKQTLERINDRLTVISDAQVANAAVAAAAITSARPKWWQQVMVGAVLALIGWMGATIWNMETARVDALQSRPATAVTVNPAEAAQPAPVAPNTAGTVQQAQ